MAEAPNNSPMLEQEPMERAGSDAMRDSIAMHNRGVRKNLESEFKHVSTVLSSLSDNETQIIDAMKVTDAISANVVPVAVSSESNAFSVHLRIRPSTSTTLEILSNTTIRAHPPRQGVIKDYTFTNVLNASTSQFDVYQQTAAPLVHGLFASDKSSAELGSSALLFCYGITNAGKTYTVTGDLNHETKWGVLPRALQDAFHRAQAANLTLQLGYMEIYNEQVYDLLQPLDKFTRTCPQVKIRENQNGLAVCKGLVQVTVESVQQGLALVSSAKAKRQTGSNNLNAGSSRSHCICQLTIMSSDKQQQVNMWIVDLAGSERSKRTDAGQARLKEASLINKSLMTLMRCLMALREDSSNKPKERPPYRDSKITHLLMNHLTGPSAGRTTMIVNVHPAECDYDETQHVLQYAAQAKQVVVHANVPNGDMKRASVQYGENGRKIVPQGQGKVAKLLAKLSPLFSPSGRVMKRKADPSDKEAHVKKMKPLGKTTMVASAAVAGAAGKIMTGDPSKEARRLKMQVTVLQTENQSLKRNNQALLEENESLKDQLEALEDNVRAEVVDEMESKQDEMNQKYESIINDLKRSLRENSVMASTSKSTRKLQKVKAEQQIDELTERLDMCEEENRTMKIEHDTAIQTLKVSHEQQVEKLQLEIKTLTDAKARLLLRKNGDAVNDDIENMDVDTLRMALQAARSHIVKLEEENASLLTCHGDGDEADESDDNDIDESEDDENVDEEYDDESLSGAEADEPEKEMREFMDCMDDNTKESEPYDAVDSDDNAVTADVAEEESTEASLIDSKADDEAGTGKVKDSHERGDSNTVEMGSTCKDQVTAVPAPSESIQESKTKTEVATIRLPLGDVVSNAQGEEDETDYEYIPPSKTVTKDENGFFVRPRGRMPKGVEDWDHRKGMWRRSMA